MQWLPSLYTNFDNEIITNVKKVFIELNNIFIIDSCFIYIIIGSAMATALQRIRSDFNFVNNKNYKNSEFILKIRMTKVRRCYQQICLATKQLNRHFEWIFMSQATYTLVNGTTLIFLIITTMTKDENKNPIYNEIVWIIEPFLRLGLITVISDRLKDEVKIKYCISQFYFNIFFVIQFEDGKCYSSR